MTTAKFGCQLPQESSDIGRVFEVAKECEDLAYDSVWAYDHLVPYWLPSRSSLECWSLLSAVAARTSKIKIGSLVTNVNLRNPSLLAKITTTVDNISDGRLILGLGIGDRMSIPELRSYGYRFRSLDDRLALLRETITVLKAMWSHDDACFSGREVKLSHAICEPKPKQRPGPPIWIGGKHPKLLDITAELADGWNHWGLSAEKVRQLESYLHSRCEELGRPSGTMTQSWSGAITTSPSGVNKLDENIRLELESQRGDRTSYFIASFPASADRKTYQCFAEAVKSIS